MIVGVTLADGASACAQGHSFQVFEVFLPCPARRPHCPALPRLSHGTLVSVGDRVCFQLFFDHTAKADPQYPRAHA